MQSHSGHPEGGGAPGFPGDVSLPSGAPDAFAPPMQAAPASPVAGPGDVAGMQPAAFAPVDVTAMPATMLPPATPDPMLFQPGAPAAPLATAAPDGSAPFAQAPADPQGQQWGAQPADPQAQQWAQPPADPQWNAAPADGAWTEQPPVAPGQWAPGFEPAAAPAAAGAPDPMLHVPVDGFAPPAAPGQPQFDAPMVPAAPAPPAMAPPFGADAEMRPLSFPAQPDFEAAPMPAATAMPPAAPPTEQPPLAAPPMAMAPPAGAPPMSPPPAGGAPLAPPAAAPAFGAPTGPPPAGAPPLGAPALGAPALGAPTLAGPPATAGGPPPAATAKRELSLPNDIKGASAMQLQGKRLRIGEVLIDMGLIDQGQLEHALSIQKETGVRLGKVLIQEGHVSSLDIARALAKRLGIEYVELGEIEIPDVTMRLIPYQQCVRYDVVPVKKDGQSLIVAMADPTNVFALDDLRLVTGCDIRVVVSTPEGIDLALSRLVDLDASVATAVDNAADWDEDLQELEDIKDSDADAPAVKLVNQIIQQAVITGASDLHFEPQADDMVVRFRKDGVLQHITTVPNKLRAGCTSRLKIMASLDISERRRPQDGRVGLLIGGKPIDLRVAILPTVYGEKAVLRVLDRSNVMMTMDQLGFMPTQLDKLRHCYTQPYGCLLVTGPTGSGKSTTLYGAVNEINDVEKNIITVEDPVEYRLKGINQVQVNVKAGLTFAGALRSILRCDPDIVMIGEMRDHETASIGIEAALTGHLVLSTLHTNTAPGALTRLTEMGIEPFLISSSILGVLAQRLARRLCKCKEEYVPTKEYLVEMGFPDDVIESDDPPLLMRAKGCGRCAGKGYKGRMGLHEVMLMSEEIAELTMARKSAEEISRVALQQGMMDLWADGVQKVLRGDTTIEELRRVVQH